jgi:hypothetical protein
MKGNSDLVCELVDVHAEVVHTEPQARAFFVRDFKIRDAVPWVWVWVWLNGCGSGGWVKRVWDKRAWDKRVYVKRV